MINNRLPIASAPFLQEVMINIKNHGNTTVIEGKRWYKLPNEK